MSGHAILNVSDLSGGYGSGIVLRNFSADFKGGEVHCVLGRNGVGKSTLLKLLAGEMKSASGTILFQDQDVATLSMSHRVRLGLSYAPQDRVVFNELTVAENLTLMRPSRSLAPFEHYLETFPRLRERLNQKAGTLSGGEKKLLSISRTLAEERQLVLLDEPTEGVQYENVVKIGKLITERKQAGAAIILVEQSLGIVESIGDKITVLDHGEIVAQGDQAELGTQQIATHLAV
ncbi:MULTISPECIES: ABC transporter ATP-binding protein [Agrobacterium tumefaciens complex]|jgi:ABC-type branched-subunit amino acid transport system ATPase component|uniref:ABC transporter ATP-binding protein n=1 Tax=Agrobacterium tumefaciens TaxID=358 RepID=UPI000FE28229|nr:ATP-binding cassette domain-containing protein [Agrobacterium tumefaciens]QAA98382.1 ABC transporter ATP-binding protein [Agrobacterium tumefaciens]QAB01093.1 ABC transporter ATP-binding protein [Agrobacterium tumefaciens]